MTIWDYSKLVVKGDSSVSWKPTAKFLEEFENQSAIRIPVSYGQFVSRFGPGMIADFYTITAPLSEDLKREEGGEEPFSSFDLATFNSSHHDMCDSRLGASIPEAQISSLVYFGGSVGGDWLLWDSGQNTSKESYECPIYVCERAPGKRVLQQVAESFGNFVTVYMENEHWRSGAKDPLPREFLRWHPMNDD